MSSIRGRSAASLCLALSSVGCSSAIPGTVDGGVTQVAIDRRVDSWRAVLVLAVDDGPTAAAAGIRAATVQMLPATLRQLAFATWAGLPSDWPPADVRVVVVRPSLEGWDSIVSPDDDPALDLITANASDDAIAATANAVTRLINAVPAEAGAPYPLLDTAGRALDLVAGTAAPTDAHEVRLVNSVDHPDLVALVIATSRDDESVNAGLLPDWWTLGTRPRWFASPVLLTSLNAPLDDCSSRIDPRTHLGAWVALDQETARSFPVHVQFASCLAPDDASSSTQGLLDPIGHSEEGICLPYELATRPEGGAACRVVATLDEASPCATHPGMLDPLDADGQRRPRTDTLIGIAAVGSVCEINELAGAEATECSSMGACAGCSPGWCATAHPAPGCATGFRFVQGAVPRHHGLVHFVCDVAR